MLPHLLLCHLDPNFCLFLLCDSFGRSKVTIEELESEVDAGLLEERFVAPSEFLGLMLFRKLHGY